MLIFIGVTWVRNHTWQDEVYFWKDVLIKSPNKARSHYQLGLAYEHVQPPMLDQAIIQFQIAIGLKPDYADAHYDLGLVFLEKGFINESRMEFSQALQFDPGHPEARRFLEYTSRISGIN